MSQYLGIIGGSNFLKSDYFSKNSFVAEERATPYGSVKLWFNHNDKIVFVQRHAANPAVDYTPPHLINKKAVVTALKNCGVSRVLAFCSTGSMTPMIPLGSIVVPDDFLSLELITFYDDARAHVIPGFDSGFRETVLAALEPLAAQAGAPLHKTGAYLQTNGPRFETRAEIRLFARDTHVVGMTSAHEAVLCKEVGLPYAAVCMVDNWANGMATRELTTHEFHEGVARNLRTMEVLLEGLTTALKPSAAVETVAETRERVASLLFARWVVPVAAAAPGAILEDHAVAVDVAGRIVAVLPAAEARARFVADVVEDFGADHALIPGLVNAHTHVGMTLLRGYSDDKNITAWLCEDIWPAEGKFVSPDFVSAGARLAFAEMLRGGTTCINDMYFCPGALAAEASRVGVRAVVGAPVIDFPDASAADGQLKEMEELAEEYKGHPLVSIAVCPHAPYTVSDANLVKCRDVAASRGLRVHMHVHEGAAEVTDSLAGATASPVCHKSSEKTAPLDNLARLGLVNDRFLAVHMVHLTSEHVALVAEKKASVVHCPSSNLKLASGFAEVHALTSAGVNVALGTDSSASNNTLDMLGEMRLSSLLGKAVAKDPTAVGAVTALQMATLNGARALGLGDVTGSLEAGKEADVVAIKLNQAHTLPLYDVISHLVYAAGRGDVTDVWVRGARKVSGGKVTALDVEKVVKEAKEWGVRIGEFRKEKAAADAAAAAAAKEGTEEVKK